VFGLSTNRKKSREVYYLLPGMGGRSYKRKQRKMMQWAIAVGLWVSALLGLLLYLLNKP